MSEVLRLVFNALASDVVDTSASNPCLLTLANRSQQRIAGGVTLASTTLSGLANAGQPVIALTATANLKPGQWLWVGGANPETGLIAPGGIVGNNVTLTANLAFAHAGGSTVTSLPTVIAQVENRGILGADAYWRVVIGPYREFPDPGIRQRAPTRLYDALFNVKVIDGQPSRKLLQDVANRLDYLLNLGESSSFVPGPLLGGSPLIFIDSLQMLEGPEEHFDYTTLVTELPLSFRAKFTKTFQ